MATHIILPRHVPHNPLFYREITKPNDNTIIFDCSECYFMPFIIHKKLNELIVGLGVTKVILINPTEQVVSVLKDEENYTLEIVNQ